ncbi:hypothetical protein [Bradyrhizobium lablabi]|uniref:hypothetical protein n=1 Tax=Bradyrhizobium lablabi TaxID=722472 RepID=UPI001BA7DCF0|nr:hypothetical protein [Bradyrhizobium lablabi]MBR0695210.1 hypothetical protein [Bradyrhizobium lablabi]
MAVTDLNQMTRGKAGDCDASIILAYVMAATLLLLALYWASTSPGMALGEFASATACP